MGSELEQLKSTLRSLVVSSPVQMDMRTLCRDYRNMMGENIPIGVYGYRDVFDFLKERCSDCFLFGGSPTNPQLTLIVPEKLKHIDKFVQKQKVNSNVKFKGKRMSVPESVIKRHEPQVTQYKPRTNVPESVIKQVEPKVTQYKSPTNVAESVIKRSEPKVTSQATSQYKSATCEVKPAKEPPITEAKETVHKNENTLKNTNDRTKNKETKHYEIDTLSNRLAFQSFMKRKTPLRSSVSLDKESAEMQNSHDYDSGRMTSSSGSSSKRTIVEELRSEFQELMADYPDGVWSAEVMRIYRERFGRELPLQRLGYTSVVSLTRVLTGVVTVDRPEETGDWRLYDARGPPARAAAPVRLVPRRHVPRAPPPEEREEINPDDALPGIEFDPDVFPSDCMHYVDSVPSSSLGDIAPGSKVELCVGEVYSPSHFWLLRLGDQYNIAMENIMDEMTEYFTKGEGKDRVLSMGAVRVGHYCSSVFEGDWHRSVIAKVIDCDTVKVRHIDYGTVERVPASKLKPLKKIWASLPAQAIRARLAGVRPASGGRRWPQAASAHFLQLIQNKRLVGDVVAVDHEENIVELFLVDTSGEDDVSINHELVAAGHADSRTDSALKTSESHLWPTFEALESGDTPNYGEICLYLRHGISLQFVPEYTRHVAPAIAPAPLPVPVPDPAPAPAPAEPLWSRQRRTSVHITLSDDDDDEAAPDEAKPSPAVANRIPLMPVSCKETQPEEKPQQIDTYGMSNCEPQRKFTHVSSMDPLTCTQFYRSSYNVNYQPPTAYYQPTFLPPTAMYYPPQLQAMYQYPLLRAPQHLPPSRSPQYSLPQHVATNHSNGVQERPQYRKETSESSCSHDNTRKSDTISIPKLDCDIYRKLTVMDPETAGMHMLECLKRCEGDSNTTGVRLNALDVDIFRRLILVDREIAHQQMITAIERATNTYTLNPDATEFRLKTSETQTNGGPSAKEALQPSVRQFIEDGVMSGVATDYVRPAPPPGFELE